jgi:hypothetical protein
MELTRRPKRAFTQKPGEDNYVYITRTIRTLRGRDLVTLYMMRDRDKTQLEAMQLWVDLRMVFWTRALAYRTVILGVLTVVAALIARS